MTSLQQNQTPYKPLMRPWPPAKSEEDKALSAALSAEMARTANTKAVHQSHHEVKGLDMDRNGRVVTFTHQGRTETYFLYQQTAYLVSVSHRLGSFPTHVKAQIWKATACLAARDWGRNAR